MIYICIPTHNEQQTVGVVLWKLRQVLTDFPRDYQLLVLDDASTDKTAEVLEPYTRVLPLTVVRSERQLGHGASLELLLREAVRRSEYPKRDVVVTLQADFSDEPDDLVPLIKRLEAGADVAVGNKVSKSKATRLRRFARALAGFFTRAQQWPEGVETPFDGYRAYRVYAVKRAIEERGGRLIRFDGWAAHAELLRQVLPHARRVDALDVVDRTDRLQRARRERPLAAALSVRSMSRGTEPAGLVAVTELDSIAATASRSRERVRLSDQVNNGRPAPRANGAKTGSRERDRDRPDHGSGRSRPRAGATDGPRTNATGNARAPAADGRSRTRGGRTQDATLDPTPDRQRKPARPKSSSRSRRPAANGPAAADPATAQAAAGLSASAAPAAPPADPSDTSLPVVDPQAVGQPITGAPVADGTAAPTRKRKRRRRRRTGSGSSTGATAAPDELANDDGAPDASTTGTATAEALSADADAGSAAGAAADPDTAEAERKPRRRGGRRGGRGRRRGPRPDGETESAPPERGSAEPSSPSAAPSPTPTAVQPQDSEG